MARDNNIPQMLAPPDLTIRRKRSRYFAFSSSPLARKIIAFNLIALGILVTGVLYLNQSNDSLVSQRREDLTQQGQIMVAALQQPAESGGISKGYFLALAQPIVAIVQLYDSDGVLVLQHLPAGIENDIFSPRQSTATNAPADILYRLWDRLSEPVTNAAKSNDSLQTRFDHLIQSAITDSEGTKQSTFTSRGDLYVSIAAPILVDGKAAGVILISTLGGEIDAFIRAEREQILQIFILAILSSIALSVVLANSIARPLRRLSEAADTAHVNARGRLNPSLIHIPDLTARPDEIGDLSRAMRQMIDALYERIDENKNFAADVSHEIKNPLTSLRSAIETMDYPLEEAERAAMMNVIRDDVMRLDRLVTDIANASRLEGELVRDVWAPVDLAKLLKQMVAYHAQEYPDISIALETGAGNHVIDGLEGRLAQVFVNLIINATSFVPKGGWIKLQIHNDGPDIVEIRVTDNGPGIPEENLQDVFERFYSERPEVEFGEHSGLGLAISRQIIEVHNGEISAQNAGPDGGAIFIIRLAV